MMFPQAADIVKHCPGPSRGVDHHGASLLQAGGHAVGAVGYGDADKRFVVQLGSVCRASGVL